MRRIHPRGERKPAWESAYEHRWVKSRLIEYRPCPSCRHLRPSATPIRPHSRRHPLQDIGKQKRSAKAETPQPRGCATPTTQAMPFRNTRDCAELRPCHTPARAEKWSHNHTAPPVPHGSPKSIGTTRLTISSGLPPVARFGHRCKHPPGMPLPPPLQDARVVRLVTPTTRAAGDEWAAECCQGSRRVGPHRSAAPPPPRGTQRTANWRGPMRDASSTEPRRD